jgi:hypothetical protein
MTYSASLLLLISRKADKNTWVLHVAGDKIDITLSCDRNLVISPNYPFYRGPGSSGGIANDYRLERPGSNPGGDEIFRPSRPALGPIQPPVQLVPVLSRR